MRPLVRLSGPVRGWLTVVYLVLQIIHMIQLIVGGATNYREVVVVA